VYFELDETVSALSSRVVACRHRCVSSRPLSFHIGSPRVSSRVVCVHVRVLCRVARVVASSVVSYCVVLVSRLLSCVSAPSRRWCACPLCT
jgi:hypothetical protein